MPWLLSAGGPYFALMLMHPVPISETSSLPEHPTVAALALSLFHEPGVETEASSWLFALRSTTFRTPTYRRSAASIGASPPMASTVPPKNDDNPAMAMQTPRNPGIDVLRGLSILLVVAHHIALRIPLARTLLASVVPKRVLSAFVSNGYEAVFVFFVISGFLITTNALARWHNLSSIRFREFYVRRASRIIPCLLLVVAVLSVLHLSNAADYVIAGKNQSLPRAIAAALGLHLNWYEGHTGYLPGGWDVLWSLSIEEVFYLAFPIVCWLFPRLALLVPVLILLALSIPFTHAALEGAGIWQDKAYLPGIAAIATGVLTAIIASRVPSVRQAWVAAVALLGTLGLGVVLFIGDLLWSVVRDGYLLVLTVASACLVLACHWQRPVAWRGTRWLRACGRLSYEIYLTHMFVVFATIRLFKAAGGDMRWGFLWYAPALAFSWLLGAGVARFFSQPSERALRRRQLRQPAPQSSS